jgi:hypothetical protein
MKCIKKDCKSKNLTEKDFYKYPSGVLYKKCKKCCVVDNTKRNIKNKIVRPDKTKEDLKRIRDNLLKSDYLDEAVDFMASVIAKKLNQEQ